MKNFLRIIYVSKFLNRINYTGIVMSRRKMMKVQTNVLCKKFMKNLLKANKMRITFRNRNKGALEINTQAITCLLYERNVDKA